MMELFLLRRKLRLSLARFLVGETHGAARSDFDKDLQGYRGWFSHPSNFSEKLCGEKM